MVRILKEMEKYALENNVPIMTKEGIEFLLNYVKEHKIKRILEIGSAIGYSSIYLAGADEVKYLKTLERDNNRFEQAVKNINKSGLNDKIDIECVDALEYNEDKKYDLIFIDAAKSQYIKFFEKYKFNLAEGGVIITDNIDFHGLVENPPKNRNTRQLVGKIKRYKEFVMMQKDFKTEYTQLGDGILISKKV